MKNLKSYPWVALALMCAGMVCLGWTANALLS